MGEMAGTELWSLLGGDDDASLAAEKILRRAAVPCGELARVAVWEAGNLWRLSWASLVGALAMTVLAASGQMFAGHLGPRELAAAAITGQGVQSIACGIMVGMAAAVQTVCGQAFGAKKYKVMAVTCQRGILLLLVAATALQFLLWYSGSLLRLTGQYSEGIVSLAQVFARSLGPAVFAQAFQAPMQWFLMAQNRVKPVALIFATVLPLHLLVSWLAVYVLGFGLVGVGLSLGFSFWVVVLFMGFYIVCSPSCKDTWTGLSSETFHGLGGYAKLAVASTFTLALEVWYVPGIGILASYLANPEISVSATSICTSYVAAVFMIMLSLGNATSVRVGNELGAGHPRVARFAVIVAVATSLIILLSFSALFLVLPAPLGKLFTSSEDVIHAVVKLSPLLAFASFLNALQPVLAGVAIASGWQHNIAYVNIAAFYLLGLPLACVLGFKTSLGAAGLWWGMIIGLFVQVAAVAIITSRIYWNEQVEKAAQRLQNAATTEDHSP